MREGMAIGETTTKPLQWSDAEFGQDFFLTSLISKAFVRLVHIGCVNRRGRRRAGV